MSNLTNLEKKAFTSFVIGIVGVMLCVISSSWFPFIGDIVFLRKINLALEFIITFLYSTQIFRWLAIILFRSLFFGFILAFFLSILGLYLGGKSLKSSKRIFAIFGIILCTISLIFSLLLGYLLLYLLTPR